MDGLFGESSKKRVSTCRETDRLAKALAPLAAHLRQCRASAAQAAAQARDIGLAFGRKTAKRAKRALSGSSGLFPLVPCVIGPPPGPILRSCEGTKEAATASQSAQLQSGTNTKHDGSLHPALNPSVSARGPCQGGIRLRLYARVVLAPAR